MPTKITEHDITGFGPKQWTGQPLKESGSIFIGSGFLTFLVCLVLMIFIPPLREIFVVMSVCTLVATIAMAATISSNVKRDKACMDRTTAEVNAFIIEATGDPNARIDTGRLQALIKDKRRGLVLQINGVPGLEIKAVPKPEQTTRIVALRTPPDYGLESFDVLLNAEQQRKS